MPSSPVLRRIPWHVYLIFFGLIITITIAGFLYYKSQKEHIKKEKQDELLAIADLKVSQVVNWRKERMADAATVSDSFFLVPDIPQFLRNLKAGKGQNEFRRWLGSFKKNYQYRDILVLDEKGTVILSTLRGKPVIGSNARRLADEAMKTGKIIFSDLYRSEVSDEIRLCIAVPIPVAGGPSAVPAGVILLRMDPDDFLYPLIQTWPTPSPTAETMLVRREGKDVLFLNELHYRKGTALQLRLPLSGRQLPAALAAQGKEGIFEGIDYRGVDVLSALKYVPESSWALVSKIDAEEVYDPILGRLGNVMLVIGLSIILAGTGVVLIWRKREEEEERKYREYLEETVNERTAELEQANKELDASYRDMESFSSSASHDLREPLVAIEGFSRNLLKKYADTLDDAGKEMLSMIRDKAGKMSRLINDLLAFSRVSTKGVVKSDIDMEALARNVFEEMKAMLGDRNVRLEIQDLPIAWGDPSMIRQVLVNLLSNALKYTRPREIGRIEIGCSEKSDENIYYVKDNGVGFESEHADKLFAPFQRLHPKEAFDGTGIGLVITKRIIEKHGGRVWAEGKVNEGATFYLSLQKRPVAE
ncbi:MAG: ATP-binding protein [bacterium]